MFRPLSNRESLRDLIVALDAHHSKCYHLGMGRNVSKSSLARANQSKDYHIFEDLVNGARQKHATGIFKLGGNVYAFDSTTISLMKECSCFPYKSCQFLFIECLHFIIITHRQTVNGTFNDSN